MVATARRLSVLLFALSFAHGCDESDEPDDRPAHTDVPAAVEGCPDGDALVDIGETRSCTCDDGTEAQQTCLSTGEYAECQCLGGGW